MSEPKRRHPNVAKISEAKSREQTEGRFTLVAHQLGEATGAAGLGCNLFEIPPGCTAFPAHWHAANEESLYILQGTGTLRIGDDKVEVGEGDYASFPVGPAFAHQLVNTGTTPLRYLCFSTKKNVEVVGYPDSDKVAALAFPQGGGWADAWVSKWFPADANVGYFHGEDKGDDEGHDKGDD